MDHVGSPDGTRIGFVRHGSGPPLVLVHGAVADHTRWTPLLPMLGAHFTVYAIDRRGRGLSDDSSDYSLEREFDDVAAVIDSIGAPVDLLGHSFGGVCSLGAALRATNLRRLILYEPPLSDAAVSIRPEVASEMESLLAAGDRDGVVTTFLREVVRMPPHELTLLRSAPAWQGRVAAAHTILREIRALQAWLPFDPDRLRAIITPTLLLLGGDSPPHVRADVESLHAALPHSRVAIMPGQQHVAMNTAPELFVREVLAFLCESV